MRRALLSIVTTLTPAALSLTVAAASVVVVTAGPVAAAPALPLPAPLAEVADPVTNPVTDPVTDPVTEEPEEVLDTALAVLGEDVGPESDDPAADRSATLALRDLALVRDELTGRDLAQADGLLARPTDGRNDRFNDGYTVRERAPMCGENICVHSVASTGDVATLDRVEYTLEVMESVHAHHTDTLAYRDPISDGAKGGTVGGQSRFDVYLADVGADGLYGYCATDDARRTTRQLAGYCVLDNDFSDFRGDADDNLRVTAAHEYFHAIQYAYDAREDTWLLEATATWVEEQYADDVNDNRQYLKGGQLRRTDRPIDRFPTTSAGIYGNWIFFEHLANRFGVDVVRRVWASAVGPRSSVPAVAAVLSSRGSSLRAAYTLFAADNTVPGRSSNYPEGDEWGIKAPMARYSTLSTTGETRSWALRLDHLTSQTVAVRSRDLGIGHRLRVVVDAPPARTSPAAYVIVHRREGGLIRRSVGLTDDGTRQVVLGFDSSRVDRVTVTLVNASPGVDRVPFGLRVTAVR